MSKKISISEMSNREQMERQRSFFTRKHFFLIVRLKFNLNKPTDASEFCKTKNGKKDSCPKLKMQILNNYQNMGISEKNKVLVRVS